jgi:aspartate-semialdehyde dehydrogenase
VQTTPIPAEVADLELLPAAPDAVTGCPLVFSSLDAAVAGPVETAFAKAGRVVVSNAKSHRLDPDVPLLVPEINADHLTLASAQAGPGAILTNPNCSTIGVALSLSPLAAAFGVEAVHVVTLQALSGAGVPGVPGMQVVDNVIPHIGGEEEKIEAELLKIFGERRDDRIAPADFGISAACNRVPVIDGHTACVSVRLGTRGVGVDDLVRAWREFEAEPQRLGLPSAPSPVVHMLDGVDTPQPRLHRELGAGMAISIGRPRPCPLFDFKFVTLSHNTIRGAAGGAILVAELAAAKGLVPEGPA